MLGALVLALPIAGCGGSGDRPAHGDDGVGWRFRPLAAAPPFETLSARQRATLAPTRSNGLTCVAAPPVRRRHGPRDRRRRVALTFDDGPSPYTAPILRELERRRARATFFQLGRQIGPYQHVVRQLVRRGHALGNHSWSHPSLAPADARTRQQLDDTAAAERRAVGHAGCLMRPPGGDIGERLDRLLRRRGQQAVLWDVDPGDWSRPGARMIVTRVLQAVRPGSIVLLHDGGGDRSQTVAAVPWIVKGLRKRGYHLVTVPTLLGLRRR
ncbi:polysaccharide deacetylase [Patulibacter medicamentivorans]|uniref:Polysaccharide deacetylase n=1 Tax=Patulibacter medicamentivorans TaxID=1097667 RepID=H0E5A9_9ACTN|nr:polysaccharide deacetylase [Patulibacter medicamentivorans]